MTEESSQRQDSTGRTRRAFVKTAGAGALLWTASGVGAAKPGNSNRGNGPNGDGPNGNGPPEGLHFECPEGTELVAKYEFDEESGEFVWEKGTKGFDITVEEYKDGDPTEPVKICWTAPDEADFIHVVGAKHGTDTTQKDVDPPTGDDEGCLDLGEDSKAISYVKFCRAACAQVDLVVGEPIQHLNGERYGDRKLRWGFWNTYQGDYYLGDYVDSNGEYTKTDEIPDGCTITAGELNFDNQNAELSATVDVECDEDVTVSLVSYRAPCSGVLEEQLEAQELFSSDTSTTSTGEVTLTIDLPGLSDD